MSLIFIQDSGNGTPPFPLPKPEKKAGKTADPPDGRNSLFALKRSNPLSEGCQRCYGIFVIPFII